MKAETVGTSIGLAIMLLLIVGTLGYDLPECIEEGKH